MEWLRKNWKIAGICAILCLVAFASAVDGFRTRRLLAVAQSNLIEEQKYLSEREAVNEGATGKKDADIERRLKPILARLADLEAQGSKPFIPPATDNETVIRWGKLGYRVRVAR